MEQKDSKKGLESLKNAIRDFVYGMAAHDMVTYSLRTRMHMENLFMLIVMGDMLGIPVLLHIIRCAFCLTSSRM